ncbi:MAG TPA: hypothetical protein VLA92_00310 [Candidatus Saccharimonadales bacterium]|nr:hypothetical protein [Candidatus Saccharimonadales bacterium]
MTNSGETQPPAAQPPVEIVMQDGTNTGATIETNVPIDAPATPEAIAQALGRAAAGENPR